MAGLRSLTVLAMMVSIVAGAAPSRAEGVRHSGTILSVNRDAGAITLGEVGPWDFVTVETAGEGLPLVAVMVAVTVLSGR